MEKGRLEAFSDGVIAVIITIMVLELHPSHEPALDALLEVAHPFFAYVLSSFTSPSTGIVITICCSRSST